MASFRYRAITGAGVTRNGVLTSPNRDEALAQLRRLGLTPVEATETRDAALSAPALKANGATRQMVARLVGELAVLLGSGLTLDRALAITIENIARPGEAAALADLHRRVKEGEPLSRAMADFPALFPPMSWAMAEAGEANGQLDAALTKLGETLDRAEQLRQTVKSAMIYPAMLLLIAGGVILVMLLFVVPQFESLFAEGGDKLPPMTRAIMATSKGLREYGWAGLGLLGIGVFALRQWFRQPAMRGVLHRLALRLPLFGTLVRNAETARFARVLGSLVDGNVALPLALGIAQRSIVNIPMAEAVGRVAAGLKQGGGLTGPLAATGLFPNIALGFLRTGEETARLGLMLGRLADVLDRDVRQAIQRLIGIMTPLITVVMGGMVAAIIASIMSAILGFNDLAISS